MTTQNIISKLENFRSALYKTNIKTVLINEYSVDVNVDSSAEANRNLDIIYILRSKVDLTRAKFKYKSNFCRNGAIIKLIYRTQRDGEELAEPNIEILVKGVQLPNPMWSLNRFLKIACAQSQIPSEQKGPKYTLKPIRDGTTVSIYHEYYGADGPRNHNSQPAGNWNISTTNNHHINDNMWFYNITYADAIIELLRKDEKLSLIYEDLKNNVDSSNLPDKFFDSIFDRKLTYTFGFNHEKFHPVKTIYSNTIWLIYAHNRIGENIEVSNFQADNFIINPANYSKKSDFKDLLRQYPLGLHFSGDFNLYEKDSVGLLKTELMIAIEHIFYNYTNDENEKLKTSINEKLKTSVSEKISTSITPRFAYAILRCMYYKSFTTNRQILAALEPHRIQYTLLLQLATYEIVASIIEDSQYFEYESNPDFLQKVYNFRKKVVDYNKVLLLKKEFAYIYMKEKIHKSSSIPEIRADILHDYIFTVENLYILAAILS